MSKRNYTDNDITTAVANSKSIAGALRLINLKPVGSNYYTLKRNLARLNLSTDHWTGQGWNKDQQLKDWASYKKPKGFRKHILKQRGYKCEECEVQDWRGKPLPLEVDHIDGDRTNNDLSNLKVLCPNCHAQTPTWRNKKRIVH